MQTACNATIAAGHLLNKHITQRPSDSDNPSSYFATLTGLGELHLKLQGSGGPEPVNNAAELLSGMSPYSQDSDGIFTSLASVVSSSEGTSVTILRQDSYHERHF